MVINLSLQLKTHILRSSLIVSLQPCTTTSGANLHSVSVRTPTRVGINRPGNGSNPHQSRSDGELRGRRRRTREAFRGRSLKRAAAAQSKVSTQGKSAKRPLSWINNTALSEELKRLNQGFFFFFLFSAKNTKSFADSSLDRQQTDSLFLTFYILMGNFRFTGQDIQTLFFTLN